MACPQASALQEWAARPGETKAEDGSEPEYQPGEDAAAAGGTPRDGEAREEAAALVVAETTGKPQQARLSAFPCYIECLAPLESPKGPHLAALWSVTLAAVARWAWAAAN